jgi:hypothetical protein
MINSSPSRIEETGMNNEQVATVADEILRPRLGPLGLDRIEVASGEDHDGDPALFVTAHFRQGSEVPNGEILSGALGALHEALQKRGELRFPYLNHRFHNDEEFEDEDLKGGNGANRR